jgi:hypothetical protein
MTQLRRILTDLGENTNALIWAGVELWRSVVVVPLFRSGPLHD